ncbi:MAG: hypothetical protein KKH34_06670 [Candidatus Omnitrophica bacterium]|nr:hypothetical protein [Candidatus Omnitrophota bacterium]
MKNWLLVFIFFSVCIFFIRVAIAEEEGEYFITTSNYANRQLHYYYYIPNSVNSSIANKYDILAMVPGLSGSGRSFVDDQVRQFAQEHQLVIIAPSFIFDSENFEGKKSYQYPSVWSGQAFLNILRDFEQKSGLQLDRMYLCGHSAGAQFVLRFALWKPEKCIACAAHASGGRVRLESYNKVKFFITIGNQDIESRKKIAQTFFSEAEAKNIKVVYKEYNTGHGLLPEQLTDSLDFFSEYMASGNNNNNDISVRPLPIPRGEHVIVHLKNGRQTRAILKEITEKRIVLSVPLGNTWGTLSFSRDKVKSIEKVGQ